MKVLFVHNNFPAQFRNLAGDLAADPRNEVRAIAVTSAPGLPGVAIERYAPPPGQFGPVHPFARQFDMECRRAQQVLFAASALAASGFRPDLVFAHCGWGENLPLRSVFPDARIAIYCEFFYRSEGQDVHFDPEFPRLGADGLVGLHCRNASTLLALADGDLGVAPTLWQRSTYPAELQGKIRIAHEGIDTERARPGPAARWRAPSGREFGRGDEVVTFVARNLEPTRGYHVFMRALPAVLRARPDAHVVIVGGDQTSYGPGAPPGSTWKDIYFNENAAGLDRSRVHFVGLASHAEYLTILQVSAVHAYLTYPFVLSWSLLEAMSVGCAIVASDTAPVREVIDRENGALVPFFDIAALSETVIDALERPEAYEERRRRARDIVVARFDRRACVARLKRVLGISGPALRAAV